MDTELEAAIDEAGRDRVFARASRHGWGSATPPEWVWWGIVQELRNERDPRSEGERHAAMFNVASA